jgi:hypothetical protein
MFCNKILEAIKSNDFHEERTKVVKTKDLLLGKFW